MSLASLTIPAGIASINESRFRSIKPSKLITSCWFAKNTAKMIPNRPPRVKISPLRRLLFFSFKKLSFEVGTKVSDCSGGTVDLFPTGCDVDSALGRRLKNDMMIQTFVLVDSETAKIRNPYSVYDARSQILSPRRAAISDALPASASGKFLSLPATFVSD